VLTPGIGGKTEWCIDVNHSHLISISCVYIYYYIKIPNDKTKFGHNFKNIEIKAPC